MLLVLSSISRGSTNNEYKLGGKSNKDNSTESRTSKRRVYVRDREKGENRSN